VRPLDASFSSTPSAVAPHVACACASAINSRDSQAGPPVVGYYQAVSQLLGAAKPSVKHHGWHLLESHASGGWLLPRTAGESRGNPPVEGRGTPLQAGGAGLRLASLGLDKAVIPRVQQVAWHVQRRTSKARVKVGIVSSTLRLHSSGRALAGLVAALARRPDELDVTVFSLPERWPETTAHRTNFSRSSSGSDVRSALLDWPAPRPKLADLTALLHAA